LFDAPFCGAFDALGVHLQINRAETFGQRVVFGAMPAGGDARILSIDNPADTIRRPIGHVDAPSRVLKTARDEPHSAVILKNREVRLLQPYAENAQWLIISCVKPALFGRGERFGETCRYERAESENGPAENLQTHAGAPWLNFLRSEQQLTERAAI
jgi:hypothetical protein